VLNRPAFFFNCSYCAAIIVAHCAAVSVFLNRCQSKSWNPLTKIYPLPRSLPLPFFPLSTQHTPLGKKGALKSRQDAATSSTRTCNPENKNLFFCTSLLRLHILRGSAIAISVFCVSIFCTQSVRV
jgi:hypothetical protein